MNADQIVIRCFRTFLFRISEIDGGPHGKADCRRTLPAAAARDVRVVTSLTFEVNKINKCLRNRRVICRL